MGEPHTDILRQLGDGDARVRQEASRALAQWAEWAGAEGGASPLPPSGGLDVLPPNALAPDTLAPNVLAPNTLASAGASAGALAAGGTPPVGPGAGEARVPSRQAVREALRLALRDEDAGVRTWASYGLARLAAPADAAALRCALVDGEARVRLWAAVGLLRTGDRSAHAPLAGLVADGLPEVRAQAARALLTVPPSGERLPALAGLLEEPPGTVRTWAAAVLAGRGDAGALARWRQALRAPATRLEAARAAPLVGMPLAARDLLAVTARLPPGVLAAPAEEGAPPLAEELTAPLPALGWEALLEDLEDEPGLRRDAYRVLALAPDALPAVRLTLLGALAALPRREVGRELAEAVADLPAGVLPRALASLAPALPGPVMTAFLSLPEPVRESVTAALHTPDGGAREAAEGARMRRLRELLRPLLPAARREEPLPTRATAGGLPEAPGEGASRRARSGSGARGPAAREVAQRARVLGALVERGQLEEAVARGEVHGRLAEPRARALVAALEEAGAAGALEPFEEDLLGLAAGGWDAGDQAFARACAEALACLLWALGGEAVPASAGPVAPREVIGRLQGLQAGPPALLPRGALREARAQCGLWQVRAEQEVLARAARAGALPAPHALESLLEEVSAAGFDGALLERRLGREAMVAEALRFAGRCTAAQLAGDGGVEGLVAGDLGFGGAALAGLDDGALLLARSTLRARHAALLWLTRGGPWLLGEWGD
jgi:HEAT repeat protein